MKGRSSATSLWGLRRMTGASNAFFVLLSVRRACPILGKSIHGIFSLRQLLPYAHRVLP